jgi:hypothetical protein
MVISKIVPKRYWHRTGLDEYRFRVSDPEHGLIMYRTTPEGCTRRISPSVVVTHRTGVEHRELLVPFFDYPVLCEALLLLGQLAMGVGNRLQRYLTLYTAYEAITDRPDPAFSSLRHALTHPATMLSSSLTVSELTRLFGSRFFNIADTQHQRVFFVQMARLLMITDTRLGRLLDYAYRVQPIASRREALHDCEVYGDSGRPVPRRDDEQPDAGNAT